MVDKYYMHVDSLYGNLEPEVDNEWGEWVRYEDYQAQAARIEQLEVALDVIIEFFRGDPASDDFEAHAVIDNARSALMTKDTQ